MIAVSVPVLFENLPLIVWLPAASVSAHATPTLVGETFETGEPRELALSLLFTLIP